MKDSLNEPAFGSPNRFCCHFLLDDGRIDSIISLGIERVRKTFLAIIPSYPYS